MSVYNKSGEPLLSVYSKSGDALARAYNASGNQIYPNGPISLRIMSYNVGEWYYGDGDNVPADKDELYYALQNGMIQRNDPDVLCIQEYWKIFSKTGRTALSMLQQYFPYIHEEGGASGYYGHCVCSKYPISNYTVRKYTDNNQRYYDSCTVTVNGIPITIVNTHLDLTQAKRDLEIQELISYLRTQNRFVACGDYNTGITPTSANVESTAYINNVKPFIDAGFNTANFGNFGFLLTCVDRNNQTHYYLDNIYTSGNISVSDAYVDDTKLSDLIDDPIDHMPLVADIEL